MGVLKKIDTKLVTFQTTRGTINVLQIKHGLSSVYNECNFISELYNSVLMQYYSYCIIVLYCKDA